MTIGESLNAVLAEEGFFEHAKYIFITPIWYYLLPIVVNEVASSSPEEIAELIARYQFCHNGFPEEKGGLRISDNIYIIYTVSYIKGLRVYSLAVIY